MTVPIKTSNNLESNSANSKQLQPKSLLGKIFHQIKNSLAPIFKTTVNVPPKSENQIDSNKIVGKLLQIKEELRPQVGNHLFKHLETAIDRDAKRIKKLVSGLTDSEVVPEQKKFDQLNDRITRWNNLKSQPNNRLAIVEAIISHHFQEAKMLIDQDLQMIADIEADTLKNLPSDVSKEQIQTLIKSRLAKHLEGLAQLKVMPEALDLHKIAVWKDNLDQQRTHHFNHAIHKIESLIAQLVPKSPSENPDEHSEEIIIT